jgi:hypothetical protein
MFCEAKFEDVDNLINLLSHGLGMNLVDLIKALNGNLKISDRLLVVLFELGDELD